MKRPIRKKLIEVALPLDAINRASAAEKLIHVGTPSNLHAWWARRPLAACRAVAFASIVDDPGEYLPAEAAEAKRRELFGLIERLVAWDTNDDEAVLEVARSDISHSSRGELPTVVDPFCGSGTIALDALRLGLNAIGCDLNPIAVAISKALVEVPHVVSGHRPIRPKPDQLYADTWGFDGFRSDLAYYSKRIFERARAQVDGLYAGTYSGSSVPIAWLWCRTAQCPNPGCNTTIPLISSLWLSKTKKSRAFLRVTDRGATTGRVTFDVIVGDASGPAAPPLNDTGAVCPRCTTPVPFAALRDQGRAGKIGFQLNAYVTKAGSSMNFHAATPEHEAKGDGCASGMGARDDSAGCRTWISSSELWLEVASGPVPSSATSCSILLRLLARPDYFRSANGCWRRHGLRKCRLRISGDLLRSARTDQQCTR
jgi:putative DNA methylase